MTQEHAVAKNQVLTTVPSKKYCNSVKMHAKPLIECNIYSQTQTECFDENLVNLCCNIGISIGSLSGTICNLRE